MMGVRRELPAYGVKTENALRQMKNAGMRLVECAWLLIDRRNAPRFDRRNALRFSALPVFSLLYCLP